MKRGRGYRDVVGVGSTSGGGGGEERVPGENGKVRGDLKKASVILQCERCGESHEETKVFDESNCCIRVRHTHTCLYTHTHTHTHRERERERCS